MDPQNSESTGCFIDIDGVIWHGGNAFENAKNALNLLMSHQIPFVFVTNGTVCPITMSKKINELMNTSICSNQVVAAQSPLCTLEQYHNKHILLCCQDDGIDAAIEIGFKNFITIPELVEIFPDLDYMDHIKRKTNFISDTLLLKQADFKPIEAIVLLGEPVMWERALQIIIDVLMTNGDPRKPPEKFTSKPQSHMPVIACNKDLTFKGAAQLPRFGHGAFLECLEHLYQRMTKQELWYDIMVGKPYISTYKFAMSALEKLNNNKKIKKLFIIGDNPDVDIKGSNMYNVYTKTKQLKQRSQRHIEIESILVCTGVFNPHKTPISKLEPLEIQNISKTIGELDDKSLKNLLLNKHSTPHDNMLNKPNFILNDLLDAVNHIINSL